MALIDEQLIVTTVSPPGISFFDALSLEPMRRVETTEPLGPILDSTYMTAALARRSGCIYPVVGGALATSCIEGVPYPRYAVEVPTTPYALLAGETGLIVVFDARAATTIAQINLGNNFAPGHGSFFEHPEHGRVFIVASMTSDEIKIIGTDPVNAPADAWRVLETTKALDAGSLFLASHKNSSMIVADSALSSRSAGSVLLLDLRKGLAKTEVSISDQVPLEGTPRVLQPLFDSSGREVWLTVWNRADETAALVVLDPESGKIKATIMDNRLTTPVRSFWIPPQ